MVQPRKWVLGLVPLAVLVLIAGFWHQGRVEQDLMARASASLAAAKLDWAKLTLSGRDAALIGEAPSPEARALAVAATDRVFGLRQVQDRSSILPEAKPFTFTALRDGSKITLTGAVPPGDSRAALLEAAKKAVPGASLVDELKPARGAAPEFAALAVFGLTELGQLSHGTLSLSDNALALSGRAADFRGFADLRVKLSTLPAGGRLTKGLAPGDILPPIAKPFTFSAERSATGLALTGFAPSEAARARVVGEARSLGLQVRDALQVADGAPSGDWAGAATLLVREFVKLEAGKATLTDEKAAITGRAKDLFTEDDIRADLRALPNGFPLVRVTIESRAIRPYLFNATRSEGGVTLTGFVPDQKTRAEILDTARRYFEGERIDDRLVEGLGAPSEFVPAVKVGLQELSRLASGASLALSNGTITLKGLALFDFARDQVSAEFRRGLPTSFKGTVEVATAPLPPPITSPPECQLLYQQALARGTVRFKSGLADLSEESRGIVDRLTLVTLRCINVRIEIGGHTDSDGSPASNAELSRRRSETVAAYMVRAGVPVARLEPVGYGQTVPVASNDTPEGKARNRRIEFIVK